MCPGIDLSESRKRQMDQLASRFSVDIHSIEKKNEDRLALTKAILKIYSKDWNYEKRGNGQLLPAYYAINNKYELAWILAIMLHIRWAAYDDDLARMELERPDLNMAKPFHVVPDRCEEIRLKNYAPLTPFVVGRCDYNDVLFNASLKNERKGYGKPYDPSPSARYVDVGDDKQYYMSYFSMNELIEILPLAFRQERYAEFTEMLFRLRYILSTGEPPKIITEGPKHRHFAPFLNMYDLWFRARFAADATERKSLAEEALFWFFETGLRSAGTTFIRDFISFADFCEIVGEFELMGERQEEFLRHFKKWTMHASISFYRKMHQNAIEPIPFAERNLPSYDEIRALYEQMFAKR